MGSLHGINLLQNHENNTTIMKIIDTLVHVRQFRVGNTCIPPILWSVPRGDLSTHHTWWCLHEVNACRVTTMTSICSRKFENLTLLLWQSEPMQTEHMSLICILWGARPAWIIISRKSRCFWSRIVVFVVRPKNLRFSNFVRHYIDGRIILIDPRYRRFFIIIFSTSW
jgi:hypothetical protein